LTPDLLTNSADFFFPVDFLGKDRYINVGNYKDAEIAMKACTTDPPTGDLGEVGDLNIPIHQGTVSSIDKAWEGWAESKNFAASNCPNSDVTSILNQDANGQYSLKPGITLATCPRLIIVPVLTITDKKTGTIEGFVAVYYKDINTGYVVRLNLGGLNYSDYKAGFGTKIVSLVE
jgi:hypothetical protein